MSQSAVKKEVERGERDDGKGEALNVIDKLYVRG